MSWIKSNGVVYDESDVKKLLKQNEEKDKRIAEFEKENERLKYNRMINEDAFFTNRLQAEIISTLEKQNAELREALLDAAEYIGDYGSEWKERELLKTLAKYSEKGEE